MENASPHRSKRFQGKCQEWKSKGLLIQFIPPYSPELNLIEMLCKHIKYLWIGPKDFISKNALQDALQTILKSVGAKYRISFT